MQRVVRIGLGLLLPVLLMAYSSGPPNGYTGAPGDLGTCTACHGGPGTQGTLSIVFPGSTYTAGDTLLVTVVLSDPQAARWGFELVLLDGRNTTSASIGTLVPADGTTQTSTSGSRTYIKHTSSGTYIGQTGQAQWTFFWIAPGTGLTPVYAYAAGNAANGDGGTTGDWIYTATATLQPVAVAERPAHPTSPMKLRLEGRVLRLEGAVRPVTVRMYNLLGQEKARWVLSPGARVRLSGANGVYLLRVDASSRTWRVMLP